MRKSNIDLIREYEALGYTVKKVASFKSGGSMWEATKDGIKIGWVVASDGKSM